MSWRLCPRARSRATIRACETAAGVQPSPSTPASGITPVSAHRLSVAGLTPVMSAASLSVTVSMSRSSYSAGRVDSPRHQGTPFGIGRRAVKYFVTGATGFIGRHLVEELLERDDATVYALVREGSRGRLDDLIKRWRAEDRVIPVSGDLSKEALGVEGFDEKIDHFFPLAAVYDMTADEETMTRANVEGTRHVVEFANSIDVELFHHVSSIAVAGAYKGLFREDMFDEGQKLPHAYHSTKFESEKLVRNELEGRLRVFRPGIVVGNSVTGEMDKVDGPYYFFKLVQKLRHALPEWFPLAGPQGGKGNVLPVDFVARALDHNPPMYDNHPYAYTSHLARALDQIAHMDDNDLYGNTFHLVDPEPLTTGETLNEFAKAAHAPRFAMRIDQNLSNVIPKQVRQGVMAVPTVKAVRNQIFADLRIPPDAIENREFKCDFDARDTQRALTGTGIAVPPLSTYADRLWDYWERNLDPDLFRERSLSRSIEDKVILVTGASSGIG